MKDCLSCTRVPGNKFLDESGGFQTVQMQLVCTIAAMRSALDQHTVQLAISLNVFDDRPATASARANSCTGSLFTGAEIARS